MAGRKTTEDVRCVNAPQCLQVITYIYLCNLMRCLQGNSSHTFKSFFHTCFYLQIVHKSSAVASDVRMVDRETNEVVRHVNVCQYPVLLSVSTLKCKSTGSLVATFLGTDNLRHPYNSIVYCGSSFPYSIQTVNDISTRSYISIYTGGYPRIKHM